MRVLLDTHAFLWFGLNDARLSSEARRIIEDLDNRVFVSPASYWEMAIKIGLGKYHLDGDLREFVEREIEDNGYEILPITPAHAGVLTTLPPHHRDPFDRMLIAQAVVEQVPLVSADGALDAYDVERLW